MQINKITFTGANDLTKIEDLLDLSKRYPKVEWGILLSASQVGTNRFPSKEWIKELGKYKDQLNLSGHLCGRYIRDIVNNGKFSFLDEQSDLFNMFKRFQLNFHGEQHKPTYEYTNLLMNLRTFQDKQFIFQIDNVNNNLFEKAFNVGVKVAALYDLSHGAGVSPEKWNSPISNVYTGYAGGLGPDNIMDELTKINSVVPKWEQIWIDMETKIRSDNDKVFDLVKVENVLEIMYNSGFMY